jgi:hypothetical protein
MVMELVNFKGTLYGKVNSQLFVWEPAWDSFRPIERIGWNGKELIAVDTKYKEDIFSRWYGYGSAEMKEVCRRLTDITELNVPESPIPWLKGEFWRDRFCEFAFECSSRSVQSWKKYIGYMNSRAKTLRKHKESRHTRRVIK